MTKKEAIDKINYFLAEEFEIPESSITPEAVLKDTLDLDSLDYVDLVVVIESNFDFKVQPGDFQNIITFQNFYDYVTGKIGLNDDDKR
ncbi:MAG: phosphopantetheine-binding protein [Prevotellaceae bacterium]|jgi:acyl carrier protein|nr:phosphopantetheine-binding protein [Prevotellaceae bacterium]